MIVASIILTVLAVGVSAVIALVLLQHGVRYRLAPLLPLTVFIIGGIVIQIVAHRTGPKWIGLWFVVAIGLYVSFLTLGFILRPILDDHHIHW